MSSELSVGKLEPVRFEPVYSERPVFSIGNGANQTRAVWERTIHALKDRGYEVIIVDFNSGNPEANFDDYEEQMAYAEKVRQAKNIFRVGWSHGANTIPRGRLDYVNGLIFIDPGMENATLGGFTDEENLDLPNKNLPHYFKVIVKVSREDAKDIDSEGRPVRVGSDNEGHSVTWSIDNLYTVDEEAAVDVFYSGVDKQEAKRLACIAANRWQRRDPDAQPPFQGLRADVGLFGILSLNDQLLTVEYKRKLMEGIGIAENRIIEVDTGHAPMVEQPKTIADALINFTNRS